MDTYEQRKKAGDEAERIVEDCLTRSGRRFHRLALEKLIPKEATWALNGHLDEGTALLAWYRYLPDYLVELQPNRSVYLDVKASAHVERRCFEHYQRVEESGREVHLAFVIGGQIKRARASQLVFVQRDWQTSTRGSGTAFKTVDFKATKWKPLD